MSTTQPIAVPSPEPIFETLTAFQRSACLKAAIDLDLFTAIGKGNDNVASIAKQIGGTERGTRILCDYLTVIGFLNKTDRRYSLPQVASVFLDRQSPAFMGSAAAFLSQIHSRHYFDDVAEVVRTGRTLGAEGGTVGADDSIWVEFARSMAPMMAMPAKFIADTLGSANGEPWKVLDIAAGHGLFGITIAQTNKSAQIWGLDLPNVLQVAYENAEKHGVADRYHRMGGSAFEVDLGSGYDIVLLTNFLHHFDPPTCEGLLRKVRAALKPGGRAATLEFVPNDDRVTPPMAASFSMMMLATTPSGDAYTFAELDRMFRNAGFQRSELHPVPRAPHSLVVSS